MFANIVLAVDDYRHSERAAEVVRTLAENTQTVVVVLHVHEIEIGPRGRLRVNDSSEDLAASTITNELRAAGVHADLEIREVNYRDVARGIALAADELDAGLIVVGSRSQSEVAAAPAIGSVSRALLHTSQRPVLVVPSR